MVSTLFPLQPLAGAHDDRVILSVALDYALLSALHRALKELRQLVLKLVYGHSDAHCLSQPSQSTHALESHDTRLSQENQTVACPFAPTASAHGPRGSAAPQS